MVVPNRHGGVHSKLDQVSREFRPSNGLPVAEIRENYVEHDADAR